MNENLLKEFLEKSKLIVKFNEDFESCCIEIVRFVKELVIKFDNFVIVKYNLDIEK